MARIISLYKYLIVAKTIYLKKIIDIIPFFRHDSYTKFIILSQPRVGSTLLLSYLNNHPQIMVKGEILSEKTANPALDSLSMIEYVEKKVYRRCSKTIQAVGFKYFYEHQLADQNFFNYLTSVKDLKIIHLKRKNLLRTYVSTKIAEATGVWSQTSSENELQLSKRRIQVNENEFLLYKKQIEYHYQSVERSFINNNVYDIFYEDLICKNIGSLASIQSFLNVKVTILRSILRKQNPEELKDLVLNFEDISHLPEND